MEEFKFEPRSDFLCIIETSIPNLIPEKYVNLIYHNRETHFASGFILENGRWSLHINHFKELNSHDLTEIAQKMNGEFNRKSYGNLARVDDKSIIVDVIDEINDLFNSLMEINGVVIYSFSLLGPYNSLYAFKYPEIASEKVTRLIMEKIVSSKFPIDILSLDNDRTESLPGFFRFNSFGHADLSKLILVKTDWSIGEDDAMKESGGIFQNEMVFKPKFFSKKTSAVYCSFEQEMLSSRIKGTAEFRFVDGSDHGNALEFIYESRWFEDFYNDVIKNIKGAIFFWGYSNGRGNVENYYIVRKDMQWEFLVGLKKHWNESTRSKHRNRVVLVRDVESLIKKMSLS